MRTEDRALPPTQRSRDVRLQLHVSDGQVKACVLARQAAAAMQPTRTFLKVHAPLVPSRPKGLQPFRVLPQTGAATELELCAACDIPLRAVHARLKVQLGSDKLIELTLAVKGRPPPELFAEGWALRAPRTRTLRTPEQRALLIELYEHQPRLNDVQRHARFQAKFSERSGPYARKLCLSEARIKAWCSAEHSKRKKAAGLGPAPAAVPAAAPAAAPAAPAAAPCCLRCCACCCACAYTYTSACAHTSAHTSASASASASARSSACCCACCCACSSACSCAHACACTYARTRPSVGDRSDPPAASTQGAPGSKCGRDAC